MKKDILFLKTENLIANSLTGKSQLIGISAHLASKSEHISSAIVMLDTCNVTGYNAYMIKSFAHKGLKDFYETGSKKGIQADHAAKPERMLDRLDASTNPQDMNLPGYRLHPLKGDKQDMWSVWVNGNWRMTFYFEGNDAYLVDYMDYH